MSRLSDIEAALTDVPTSAKMIWCKIDCWSPTSVKQVLDEMVAAGRAVRTADTNLRPPVHKRNLYARPIGALSSQRTGRSSGKDRVNAREK